MNAYWLAPNITRVGRKYGCAPWEIERLTYHGSYTIIDRKPDGTPVVLPIIPAIALLHLFDGREVEIAGKDLFRSFDTPVLVEEIRNLE